MESSELERHRRHHKRDLHREEQGKREEVHEHCEVLIELGLRLTRLEGSSMRGGNSDNR